MKLSDLKANPAPAPIGKKMLMALNLKHYRDPRSAMYASSVTEEERDRRRARGKAQRRSRKINRRR